MTEQQFITNLKGYITNPAQEQVKFAETVFEHFDNIEKTVFTNSRDNSTYVINARCGIGKSQCVKALCKTIIQDTKAGRSNNLLPIIITDNLERLEQMANDSFYSEYSAFIRYSKDILPTPEQIKQATEKRLVFLTTQKVKDLTDEELQNLLTYKNTKRNFIIFDEKPIFFDIVKIGVKELNNIDTALEIGIPTTAFKEREYVLSQYKDFRGKIKDMFYHFGIETVSELFICSNDKDGFNRYVKHFDFTIADDKERFFKIIAEYKDNINGVIPKAVEMLEYINYCIENNCIIQGNKTDKATTKNYDFAMLYLKDNTKILKLDIPTLILDATADYEPLYNLDFIKRKQIDFTKPDNLNVINVVWSINRQKLEDIPNLQRICDSVKTMSSNSNKLVITYKPKSKQAKELLKAIGAENFGNIKGKNNWSKCNCIIQIGLNRQSGFNYFMKHMFMNPYEYADFLKSSEAKSKNTIINATKLTDDYSRKGFFADNETNELFINDITADIIQNLFRCSLRDFNSSEQIIFYLYCGENYFDIIEHILERNFNAKILESNKEFKIKVRKQNNNSTAGKIIEFINSLPENADFTTKNICEVCDIDSNKFNNAKKHNQKLQALLDNCKIARGKFKKI